MAKTEKLLQRIAELERETGIRRTLFAACPNSTAVIKAAFRAAKRNNAPIYFAATLNQIDCDGGYTGMRPDEFVKLVRMEAAAVNFDGIYIVAIDHGGPWLKDKQRTEKWSTEAAMDGVKRSFEAALLAGYDLIHVDPTVDINVPAGQTIDIRLVAARTVELIRHCETFRRAKGLPEISYEVGTEEVHGGLADERTFDTFIAELKARLAREGLSDIWPCFIVGKVGPGGHVADKAHRARAAKRAAHRAADLRRHALGDPDGTVLPRCRAAWKYPDKPHVQPYPGYRLRRIKQNRRLLRSWEPA